MSDEDKHPLEWVSQVTELNEMCEFLQDPAVDEAMDIMVRLYMDKMPQPSKVLQLIVKLQAISGACAVKAKYHMIIDKNTHKKNTYYTLREAIDKLVDSLKYIAKYGHE